MLISPVNRTPNLYYLREKCHDLHVLWSEAVSLDNPQALYLQGAFRSSEFLTEWSDPCPDWQIKVFKWISKLVKIKQNAALEAGGFPLRGNEDTDGPGSRWAAASYSSPQGSSTQ